MKHVIIFTWTIMSSLDCNMTQFLSYYSSHIYGVIVTIVLINRQKWHLELYNQRQCNETWPGPIVKDHPDLYN